MAKAEDTCDEMVILVGNSSHRYKRSRIIWEFCFWKFNVDSNENGFSSHWLFSSITQINSETINQTHTHSLVFRVSVWPRKSHFKRFPADPATSLFHYLLRRMAEIYPSSYFLRFSFFRGSSIRVLFPSKYITRKKTPHLGDIDKIWWQHEIVLGAPVFFSFFAIKTVHKFCLWNRNSRTEF